LTTFFFFLLFILFIIPSNNCVSLIYSPQWPQSFVGLEKKSQQYRLLLINNPQTPLPFSTSQRGDPDLAHFNSDVQRAWRSKSTLCYLSPRSTCWKGGKGLWVTSSTLIFSKCSCESGAITPWARALSTIFKCGTCYTNPICPTSNEVPFYSEQMDKKIIIKRDIFCG
jgi:hypothetical protein